jgi:hypothetical protein
MIARDDSYASRGSGRVLDQLRWRLPPRFRNPSAKMAWAKRVEVLVPSPTALKYLANALIMALAAW